MSSVILLLLTPHHYIPTIKLLYSRLYFGWHNCCMSKTEVKGDHTFPCTPVWDIRSSLKKIYCNYTEVCGLIDMSYSTNASCIVALMWHLIVQSSCLSTDLQTSLHVCDCVVMQDSPYNLVHWIIHIIIILYTHVWINIITDQWYCDSLLLFHTQDEENVTITSSRRLCSRPVLPRCSQWWSPLSLQY